MEKGAARTEWKGDRPKGNLRGVGDGSYTHHLYLLRINKKHNHGIRLFQAPPSPFLFFGQ